ncbi:unnamed protein product [Medioppia subpectinata]|uniref:Uncharacterized protein n=1 Tax=Medioppia subpectinata TaxID=1979941 RepID=A0A7R9KI90_9ACAR|nr:unnamed protein product [Medioppia subpectinata]CAG2102838.1 unnamed protein product [Medioppia subpectinata]
MEIKCEPTEHRPPIGLSTDKDLVTAGSKAADDDTYVIMDNLDNFIAPHRPHEPLYFGCKLQYRDVVYMSDVVGHVLSRAAVKQFFTAGVTTG